MVDVTVTAASVRASAQAVKGKGTAGGTITAGQTLYVDTSDNNDLKAADADASAAASNVVGIALHGAADGQPLEYVISDPSFTPGFTVTVGTVYVASATAGGIAPVADLTSNWYPTVLMVGLTSTTATMKILHGTVAIA